MGARSVYCGTCKKSYYPCPETRTDAECCKNACKDVPTNTPKQNKHGGAVGPNGIL